MSTSEINTDQFVRDRYSAASKQREQALCCPVVYDAKWLEAIPEEVIQRDYGCGDPSPYVGAGDTVLDLGSGGGKLCFIISQLVGPQGRVIGVDFNPDMLRLARKHRPAVAEKIGFDNIDFRCGRIQDLAIDLESAAEEMQGLNVTDPQSALDVITLAETIRRERPMIADDSVDVVVSNCVLNLVRNEDRQQLFKEIFRVLKPGGIAAISDIVADEDVPEPLQQDAELWSGCLAGAWREDRFVDEFVNAGFGGVTIDQRQSEPWQTVEGIEFRSVTVLAVKLPDEVCLERNQAVIYKGPFARVTDDEGNSYRRGDRVAVCDRTFRLINRRPFAKHFYSVEPIHEIPLDQAERFDCEQSRLRDPRETKGRQYNLTIQNSSDCCGGSDSGSCC